MSKRFLKVSLLGLLLVMCMSVAMAADVSEDTTTEVTIPSTEIEEPTIDVVENDNVGQTNQVNSYNPITTDTVINDSTWDNQTYEVSNITSNVNDKIITKNIKSNIKTENSNIILNSNNFDDYVSDGKFNDNVTEGDTIDIQGKLDGSRFALNVNKPVNIISSTHDAYIDFHTGTYRRYGESSGGIFQVTKEGSGTNITDIIFYTTRVSIENTSDVYINNISCLDESAGIGNGVGSFTVREGSENITVTNSYFKAKDNGGHSNVVFAAAYNCLFENNTVENYGNNALVGNTLYLTTYNVEQANPKTNINITIRNNTIRSHITIPMATCWGLVLEGKGHLIENNYIAAGNAVVSQYADSDYDFETIIDGITFRNNYIEYGGPQFYFPGEVYNNTINGFANFGNIKAYNNTLDKVRIENNTLFENNTAKEINITGKNNKLNNNEVYSDEDYAVFVSGENNTLSNNKFASLGGRGEPAISNSTGFFSINNTEEFSRTFYIDANNINNYTNNNSNIYTFKEDVILKDGDIILFNFVSSGNIQFKVTTTGNITIRVIDPLTKISRLDVTASKCYIVNSSIPRTILQGPAPKILINSIVGSIQGTGDVTTENSVICFEFTNNTYVVSCGNPRVTTKQTISKDTGYFLDSVNETSRILVHRFLPSYAKWYTPNIYVDKQLYFENIPGYGDIDANVTFVEGSEFTTVNGITFKQNVYVNTENIKFTNCIFNGEVIVNNSFVNIENCTFGGKISLNNSNSLKFEKNIITSENSISIVNSRLITINNNTITTAADNTIVFDEESNSNTVKNNILIANTLLGDDSVVGGDNTVEDNGPSYNTSIEITSDDSLYKNDEGNVTITVYSLLNNTPVDKGYVEVYLDGVLQGIKPLVNGQITLEVNTEKSSLGAVPLKVWYYDGKYANNVTSIIVDIVKSNVSITFNQFSAKLNEKATGTAIFLNQKGNPIRDTNVTFTVGRSSYTVETVDGVATLNEMVTREWLDAGKIAVIFPSTDAYNANSTTITLNTSKADVLMVPVVSVDGNVADVELTLSDNLGENVTDGRVVLSTLDGQELASGRVSNGKFISNVALPEGYSDEYLVANFTGSYYYNDFVRNVKITQMLNSTISLETNSPLYGEELVITGKLVDSKNTPIGGANLTLNLNGSKVIVTTNDDGEYNYTYTPGLGVNSLTVTFDGTVDVYGSSASKDVTIRDTDREMNEVLDRLDELTSENAKLKEQLENLTQLSNDLKEQLANQTSELSEQNAALQQQINTLSTIISALTDIIDKQNEQIAALTAPENTTIVLNQVTDAKFKANVVISGMLNSQKGMALSGQKITLTIGETSVNVTTKNGEFEYTTSFKAIGEQTVTASYAGNDNYNPSEDTISFNVDKQDVIVSVDPIADASYGDSVTITGKFTDATGKAISNSNVRVVVNGKKYIARTDKTGAYSVDAKVSQVGENTVTVGYAGNTNYNAYEDTITFNADKQDVIVTVNAIEDTKVGENITITGTFTYANGKAVTNSNVKILINGKKYLAKTDSTGAYTLTTLVTKDGINNITVGYSGNDRLNSYEDTITFNAEAQDVIITADSVADVTLGENVTITGKFTDKNGKAITNSVVRVTFDGKKYSARTDNTGSYTFTATTKTEGTNTITLNYAGSTKYNAYETSTTFNVIKTE